VPDFTGIDQLCPRENNAWLTQASDDDLFLQKGKRMDTQTSSL